MDDETKKQIKELTDDAKKVQDTLSKANITNTEYLHSIPIIVSEFYPNRDDMIQVMKLLVKQSIAFHKMMYDKKRN